MLIFAVLFPMAAGALLPLFRFKEDKSRGLYVMAVVLITSAVALPQIILGTAAREILFQITETLPIAFRLDGVGRIFAGIVAVLWPLSSLYALEYMQHEKNLDAFFSFYTICFGVTLGIACASNLMTLYLFYELMTLITLPLVMHGGSQRSVRAGLKYLYYSIGGAALAFIGLVYVIYYGGTTEFAYGGVSVFTAGQTEHNMRIGYLICFFGFGVKAAVFPLHDWLPDASVAPTPVTALLHAVAVVKSGVFAIIRITWFTFAPALLAGTFAQYIPLALCVFTIVYGCTMALKEQNLKRRLAYSTVSNLSYILFGALLMTSQGLRGGLMHMVYHAVMKITLFLCAGVYLQKGVEYVQDMRGLHRAMPVATAVFALGSLAMTGIPPLLGFGSKWALAEAAVFEGGLLPVAGIVALVISATLTAFYLIIPSVSTYVSRGAKAYAPGELSSGWKALSPLLIISLVMMFFSFWPMLLTDFITYAAAGGL
ncbi:MAG: proton-conducting transporter membrane subunit [Eubacteriales bacterium]|nr:proton-conducting transporter membrane subunit [Eubacteriales bacterium]